MPPKKGILKPAGSRRRARLQAEANGNATNTATTTSTTSKVRFAKYANESFSKEEIASIVARHKQIVDSMNKYLPDDQKISVDPNLERKLQSGNYARMYHLGQEIKQRPIEQDKIYEDIKKKYGSPKNSISGFNVKAMLRTGKTEEDKVYNETLYREFKDNPQKFLQRQYEKILKTNAQDLYDLGNDPVKQAEYFIKNYEVCNYASNMSTVVNAKENKDVFTNEFKENSKSVGSLAHTLFQTKYAAKAFDSIDKLAFPEISQKQAEALYDSMFSSDIKSEEVSSLLSSKKWGSKPEPSPKEIFDNIKQKTGVDLTKDENFMTNHIFTGEDGKAIDIENIDSKFKEVKVVEGADKKRNMNFITNNFKNIYAANWRKSFNQKMGVDSDKLDIKTLDNNLKGGFFNRMFRRPSKEYTAMMEAFKDYHNPESPNYMNKEALDSKTQAYVDHKNSTGKKLTTADEARMRFAKNILETNNEIDKLIARTENAFADRAVKRVTFLLPEDVNVEIVSKDKENVVVKVHDGPEQQAQKNEEIEL